MKWYYKLFLSILLLSMFSCLIGVYITENLGKEKLGMIICESAITSVIICTGVVIIFIIIKIFTLNDF